MSQNIENIKSCYPLFEQDEYQNHSADKVNMRNMKKRMTKQKFVKYSSGRPLKNTKI